MNLRLLRLNIFYLFCIHRIKCIQFTSHYLINCREKCLKLALFLPDVFLLLNIFILSIMFENYFILGLDVMFGC